MDLTLNVYNGKEIEKTYTSTDYRLMTGTCEDILKLVDIDKFKNADFDDDSMMFEVLKVVIGAFDSFRPLLQDVFEGLTDNEYRRTAVKEVGQVIFKIVTYTITELFSISEKN